MTLELDKVVKRVGAETHIHETTLGLAILRLVEEGTRVEEDRIRSHSSVANGDGGAFYLASEHPELSPLFADDTPTRTPEDAPEAANYLITIRTDGDGRRAMIALLNQMGRFAELMPGTFVLNAPVSALDLRNQLATVLAERGKFVIVNADSGQLAWMGLGADIDQHARTVWKRDL